MELFYTMLLRGSTPLYYNVSKEGNEVIWTPAANKNHLPNPPAFRLKHEGHEWLAETIDFKPFNDQELISQAIEDLKGYYFNK